MKRQVIIGMKGRPSAAKTRLALSIAEELKYPFMDHDDLVPALQQRLPPSLLHEDEFINDFSFEAICLIAQSQLRLNLSVLITSPLSNQTHFNRLVDLADSNNSTLLLIDCRSSQEESSPSNYDVGDITRLILDLTHEQVEHVMQFIRSGSDLGVDFSLGKAEFDFIDSEDDKEIDSEDEEIDSEDDKEIDSEDDDIKLLKDFAHSNHPLVFSDNEEKNNHDGMSCKACLEPIWGQIYSCVECNFFLHKSCAELPHKTNSPIMSEIGTLHLNPRASVACWACGDQREKCVYHRRTRTYGFYNFLELDPKCVKSPSVLELDFHPHKLYLSTDNALYGYGPKCNACGSECWPVRYSCSECDIHLHVRCALLPALIKHKCHCDPLILTPPQSPALSHFDFGEECYCDVCETEREVDHWFYYCSDCDFAAHLSCVISNMNPYRDSFNTRRDEIIRHARGRQDIVRRKTYES